MKRCPQCNRVETDDALVFCRADGAALVSDSASISGEAGTAKFVSGAVSSETETSILPNITDASINRATAATTVLQASGPSSTTRELNKSKRLGLVFALIALAVVGVAIAGYFYFARKNNAAIQSIAVMPFVNAGGNADTEYLSDGMTETLISSLSQLPNVSVKARSSVFRYKGKDADPKTVGKELSVQALLNGRIVQRGDQLTLSLELIDTQTENVLWSEQYNRTLANLITLQSEIARDVSQKLKTKLTRADEQRVTKAYTDNVEAYQLYLKGRYYNNKATEEGYKRAIECFNQAIAIDPNYALAYAGVADAYITASDWYLSNQDSFPKTKAAARKALELDDSLAEAHNSLATALYLYDFDWPAAEREFKRAIELNPNYAWAHAWYGAYLQTTGKVNEAIDEVRLAQRLDPLALNVNTDVALIYYGARQFDQAVEAAQKTVEMDQNFWYSRQTLGLAYEQKGKLREAITELEKARALDNNPLILGYLGHAYAAAGQKAEAQKVLDQLGQLSKQRYVTPYAFALVYAGLGEKDKAFEWLDKAYEDRSWMTLITLEPDLDHLRSDPRFADLVRRVGLPQ